MLDRLVRHHGWAGLTGLVLGLLALGPALGRGFVLTFDMVFVPQPPLGAADIGLGGGPPRAVPSDLVIALLARIIPADVLQKVILLGIFVLACSGAAALLRDRPGSPAPRTADESTGEEPAARTGGDGTPQTLADSGRPSGTGRPALLAELACGTMYVWNPYVAERLIMGQWALLLGYAGLPWVLRELCLAGRRARPARLAAALLPAAIGGFAAMSVSAVAALPAALGHREPWSARLRRLMVTVSVLALLSLVWVIPAIAVHVVADPRGAQAFAARADTPFGAAGSLLMLGGIWNSEAVPAGYGGWASIGWLIVAAGAVAGYLLLARRWRLCPGLGAAACAGTALAAIGLTAPTRAVLAHAISFWPAFAVLRDGQQFVAPLALAESVGLGAAVCWLLDAARRLPARRDQRDRLGPAVMIAIAAMLAPVLLLPGLAWGAAGRLQAVPYPADWLRARAIIAADRRPGSVLLLPWAQYRRYGWNNGEPVFDPWPRLLGRPAIWNDALRVGPVTVAAESAQARRFGPLVTSGHPLTAALRAAGVRYVVIDAGPLLHRRRSLLVSLAHLPAAQVVLASGDLILFRLPNQ